MKKDKLLIKIGDFITDFRYLFLSLFIIMFIICTININNYKTVNDITEYLPKNTETKYGLNLMEKEFGSLTTIKLMVNNNDLVTKLNNDIANIENVSNLTTKTKDNKTLFTIQLVNKNNIEIDSTINEIKKLTENTDAYIYSEHLENPTEGINLILLLAVIVIVTILLITSKTYFEVIIAFIIFGISIVLNMGSNFLLGEISYITKSIAVILQLALSIDYVIIFMNQFMKEINDTDDTLLAIKKTTSKALPEIFASALTTIAGLLALIFMQLKIGGDIGIVLSKGIICSLFTVILLMPCLLVIFVKPILYFKKKEKTKNLNKIANFIVNKRKILLTAFIICTCFSLILIPKYNYVYDTTSINSIQLNNNTKALKKIEEHFGYDNTLVILAYNPHKDYNKELELANKLSENDNINSITSIGNYQIAPNLYLGSKLNYIEFSNLFNIDTKTSLNLYQLFIKENDFSNITTNNDYKIDIISLIYFLKDNENSLPLSNEIKTKINYYYTNIVTSINLLESNNYTRFILSLNLPIEDNNINKIINDIRVTSQTFYDEITLVGNSINALDLKTSFTHDNTVITSITIIFIALILLVNFKSLGMAILLILTIEGSILINFGLTTLFNSKIFFMSYVIISAIQMGATIDYAIVISSRYVNLRKKYEKKEAIVGTLADMLPAVITSGLILLLSGFLIAFIATSPVISSIGLFLGIGTFISLIATIFVLPAILYACDKFIKITTFSKK